MLEHTWNSANQRYYISQVAQVLCLALIILHGIINSNPFSAGVAIIAISLVWYQYVLFEDITGNRFVPRYSCRTCGWEGDFIGAAMHIKDNPEHRVSHRLLVGDDRYIRRRFES